MGRFFQFFLPLDVVSPYLTFLKSKNESGFYPELIAAVLNGQEKKFQEAHDPLALALQKDPDHPVALYYSGSLHLARNRLDQAEKAFIATLHASAEFAPALAGLGQVYWLKKQTDKAVASYQKAIAAEPETLFYRRQLIAILKATNQKEAESRASTDMLYWRGGYEKSVCLLNLRQLICNKGTIMMISEHDYRDYMPRH